MQKPNNRKWIIPLAALAALVLIAAVLLLRPRRNETDVPSERPGEDGVLRVTVVGDIRMTPSLVSGARSNGSHDYSEFFFGVAGLLQDADLTIGNLECSFTGTDTGEEGWAPDVFASELAGLGFDVLQTANSYSILGGVNGLNRTMEQVREAGMETVGTSDSPQAYQENRGVYLREINGIRVAVAAFTKGLNNMSLPEGMDYAVNLLYSDYDTNYSKVDTAAINEVMSYAREQNPDVILALVHWGTEDERDVSKTQKQIAELLLENGADAIVGTHSHRVGPIETRQVRGAAGQKNAVVAYGLGDFYSDSDKYGQQETIALRLEFRRNDLGAVELTAADYTPVYKLIGPHDCQVWDATLAIDLYDQDYIYRVTDEQYEQISAAVESIEKSVHPEEEEE